jgi:hypothetical protein
MPNGVKFTAMNWPDFKTVELAVRSSDTQMERFTVRPQISSAGIYARVQLTIEEAQQLVNELASVGIKAQG